VVLKREEDRFAINTRSCHALSPTPKCNAGDRIECFEEIVGDTISIHLSSLRDQVVESLTPAKPEHRQSQTMRMVSSLPMRWYERTTYETLHAKSARFRSSMNLSSHGTSRLYVAFCVLGFALSILKPLLQATQQALKARGMMLPFACSCTGSMLDRSVRYGNKTHQIYFSRRPKSEQIAKGHQRRPHMLPRSPRTSQAVS
jgi:hypothetical protein